MPDAFLSKFFFGVKERQLYLPTYTNIMCKAAE